MPLDFRFFDDDSAEARRLWLGSGEVADVVGRVRVSLPMVIGRCERRASQSKIHQPKIGWLA